MRPALVPHLKDLHIPVLVTIEGYQLGNLIVGLKKNGKATKEQYSPSNIVRRADYIDDNLKITLTAAKLNLLRPISRWEVVKSHGS